MQSATTGRFRHGAPRSIQITGDERGSFIRSAGGDQPVISGGSASTPNTSSCW
jgi:hypothetical protein